MACNSDEEGGTSGKNVEKEKQERSNDVKGRRKITMKVKSRPIRFEAQQSRALTNTNIKEVCKEIATTVKGRVDEPRFCRDGRTNQSSRS